MWMILLAPTWSLFVVCILLSLLVLIFLKQIRRPRLRIVLMATYFCISLLCLGVIFGFRWGLDLGMQWEFLRQSSVNTSENVRILTLLEKSDARQVDPFSYQGVMHNLENEIDFLLPFANDYLAGKGSLERRLHDLLLGDLTETTFPRDLPLSYNTGKPIRLSGTMAPMILSWRLIPGALQRLKKRSESPGCLKPSWIGTGELPFSPGSALKRLGMDGIYRHEKS